jgi:uncharacterized protein YndB with AHSA1/START domain
MNEWKSRPTQVPGDRVLVITRVFDAPRRLVFEAWTKKEHLDQWCAPRGFTIPSSEGELRPGGAWRSWMRSPEGVEYRLSGIYREVVQDELLVFTHSWEEDGKRGHETVVTVRFADHGDKTKLTFEQAIFETVESRDSHRGGWTECLERLADHLAKLRVNPGS